MTIDFDFALSAVLSSSPLYGHLGAAELPGSTVVMDRGTLTTNIDSDTNSTSVLTSAGTSGSTVTKTFQGSVRESVLMRTGMLVDCLAAAANDLPLCVFAEPMKGLSRPAGMCGPSGTRRWKGRMRVGGALVRTQWKKRPTWLSGFFSCTCVCYSLLHLSDALQVFWAPQMPSSSRPGGRNSTAACGPKPQQIPPCRPSH
jgi:hypothetical protein